MTVCRTRLAGVPVQRYSGLITTLNATRPAMKKILTFALILMLLCLFLDKVGTADLHINGNDLDGPFEWLFGMVVAGAALLGAAILVGVVAAGVGLLLACVLGMLVLLALLFSSPLLLPLLAVALIWMLVRRDRRQNQP